jgi:hypothetical protein
MLTTILEIAGLLAIIILPLRGPSKKKKKNVITIDRDVSNARYAIDENGSLVEFHGRALSGHEH